VGTAGRILDAEYLHVVAQFAQRGSGRSAAQSGSDNDDVEFSFVGRAHYLDGRLVVVPLLRKFAGRNFSI
jgi:hypothetical protein